MTVDEAKTYTCLHVADMQLREREKMELFAAIVEAVLGADPYSLADDTLLLAEQEKELRRIVHLCGNGMPLRYAVGRMQYHGLELKVREGVYLPCAYTEPVVDAAIELLRAMERPRIIDLGTGAGAFAVSLAVALPHAFVTAVDISPAAIMLTRENARLHGCEERVEAVNMDIEGFVDEVWDGEPFDLALSNPPYIKSAEASRDRWQPAVAFDGGEDGLDGIRLVARSARRTLKPGGWLLCCCPFGYDEEQRAIFEDWEGFRFERLPGRLERYFAVQKREPAPGGFDEDDEDWILEPSPVEIGSQDLLAPERADNAADTEERS